MEAMAEKENQTWIRFLTNLPIPNKHMTKENLIQAKILLTQPVLMIVAVFWVGCIVTAGPWHMRFFRLGKIRMSQIRMTEI